MFNSYFDITRGYVPMIAPNCDQINSWQERAKAEEERKKVTSVMAAGYRIGVIWVQKNPKKGGKKVGSFRIPDERFQIDMGFIWIGWWTMYDRERCPSQYPSEPKVHQGVLSLRSWSKGSGSFAAHANSLTHVPLMNFWMFSNYSVRDQFHGFEVDFGLTQLQQDTQAQLLVASCSFLLTREVHCTKLICSLKICPIIIYYYCLSIHFSGLKISISYLFLRKAWVILDGFFNVLSSCAAISDWKVWNMKLMTYHSWKLGP